jgi:hypothetical protein
VDPGEFSARSCLKTKTALDFIEDVFLAELSSPILGQASHRRLGREPVSPAVYVEVRGAVREAPERIAEDRCTFAWLDASQPHLPVVDPSVRGTLDWS